MSAKITSRWGNRNVLVLDVEGRITLGDGSRLLRDKIREEIAKDHKNILVNFSEVSYIDG